MGLLRDFEKRLEGVVEGFFARALPGGTVQPVELGKRMVRAMEENKTVGAAGVTYVPNAFLFSLSKKDYEKLRQIESRLKQELVAVARRAAAGEGWQFVGPPEIHLQPDGAVKAGTFDLETEWVQSAEPEPQAGPQTQLIQMSLTADAELVMLGKHRRTWPLSKDRLVLGRMEGCDVMIPDASISRKHAELVREGDEWVLVDLGSTNGTEVNGKRVNRHRLEPGDRVALGETTLEFRRP